VHFNAEIAKDIKDTKMVKLLSIPVALIFLLTTPVVTQERLGSMKGTVVDADTKSPLIGANVYVLGTTRGAATDDKGVFGLENIPVGSYTVQASYIGYNPLRITDVIVRSSGTTNIHIELRLSYLESEAVEVTAGYFDSVTEQPVSIVSLSREEVRRAPGAAGDVSRIVQVLPSIAKVNDQYNGLIVRGGSPIENAFYVDNIEIPNINHFPAQGSTGGAVGLLYVDFIEDINFYTGGAPALFGNRLSSVMDIRFREGNREEFSGKLFLDMAGFGGIAEGPMLRQKGSWLLSVRRSYVDVLVDIMDLGVTPVYSDLQAKIVYDPAKNHRFTLVAVAGHDKSSPTRDQAESLDFSVYGSEKYTQSTLGLNWRWLWSANGYTNTSLSYSGVWYRNNWSRIRTEELFIRNSSHESWVGIRNRNRIRFNPVHTVEFGFDTKILLHDYDYYLAESVDLLGNISPSVLFAGDLGTEEYGVFLHYIVRPFKRLQATIGARTDYYANNDRYSVSPRLSVSYSLTDRTSINGSVGFFTQSLPHFFLVQNERNRELDNPRSIHYIAGINHLLTEDTKLIIEAYRKEYKYMPLNPSQPSLFVLDETLYQFPFYLAHQFFVDTGTAEAQGVEANIQKKLAKSIYGIAGASYSVTRYTGYDGIRRKRVFDNRIIINIGGGYKPNEKWEFSLRWVYAGGTPYTPFDIERSREVNSAVFDETRINADRHPDYHSLSIRFDKRFHFASSNLIFYLDVWNVYNRKNVAAYFWNEFKNEQDIQYQWGIMPVFGVEFEL
jgi:hypothetical protein